MTSRVAEASTDRGEVNLLRRESGALELRVNGVFVMDTNQTTTERQLASTSIEASRSPRDPLRVLIGGLGLGFTLDEVLSYDEVVSVVVAEIEPALVQWHRQGLIDIPPRDSAAPPSGEAVPPRDGAAPPTGPSRMGARASASVLDDPRVEVHVADVRAVVAAQAQGLLDAVLLDVDNGPDQLVYEDNAAVYGCHFLRTCRTALTSTGVLAVWSARPSDDLTQALRAVFADVVEQAIPVRLGNRLTTYHLYRASGSAA